MYREINATDASAGAKSVNQVLATAQSIMQNEAGKGADLYYYSDFQQSAFPAQPDKSLMKDIFFYGLPVQTNEAPDIYIDTAWLTTPVLQTGKSNYIVVRTRLEGKAPKENPVLNLVINGQVKSAAQLNFSDKNESVDTLSFQVSNTSWQEIAAYSQ